MRRRLLLAVTGWLVTGLLAIGAGVAVIDRLGEPLTDTGLRPLSAAEVDEALALASSRPGVPPGAVPTSGTPSRTSATAVPSAPATPPAPTATPGTEAAPAPTVTVTVTRAPAASAAPTATGPAAPTASAGRSGVIETPGGRVVARCQNALVTLRSWSPAQGFQADDVERGPASRAYVEFESDEREIKIEVYCAADGSPAHRVRA